MPDRLRIAWTCRVGLLLAAIMLMPAGPGQADPVMLRVNTFPNAKALALRAGIAKGIFAKRGLAVELEFTESSKAQRDGLAAGRFQIAQGAIDNAVAMIEGRNADVVIVSGGDSGMNEFFAQAGITSFADLRGRVILVDAPDTAYALQVKKLMSQHGLGAADYTIKPAGAGVYRFKAMQEDRNNAAAVLNPPFTVQAEAMGMRNLGDLVALLGPYQGVGVFALRTWAEQNSETLERFLAAEVEAVRYVRDPAHRADSIALLIDGEKLPRAIAERTYDQLVDPAFGFTPDARLDMQGLRNMLALRAEVEGKPQAAPERYLDLRYYERAMELVGR